jgi:hypothetical protein
LDKQLNEKLFEHLVSMAMAQKVNGSNSNAKSENARRCALLLPKVSEGESVSVSCGQRCVGRAVVKLFVGGGDGLNITVRTSVEYPNGKAGAVGVKGIAPNVEVGININRAFETLAYRYALIGALNVLLGNQTQEHLNTLADIQGAHIRNGQEGKNKGGGGEG